MLDYSQNTQDIAFKLLTGQDVSMSDVDDVDELKRLLNSRHDLNELACDAFLQGQNVRKSISFDDVEIKLNGSDISDRLMRGHGATGVVVEHYPNGQMGATITFKVGEDIVPEPPEQKWDITKSDKTIIMTFDQAEMTDREEIIAAIKEGLSKIKEAELLGMRVKVQFGDNYDIVYASGSGYDFLQDPERIADILLDDAQSKFNPADVIGWDDAPAPDTSPKPF